MELPKKIRFLYTSLIPRGLRKKIELSIRGDYPKLFDEKCFIFIHIPKTAGKSVNRIIGLQGACHLTYAEYENLIGEKIKDYYLFSIIRHPYDRIISAYNYLADGGNQSIEDINFKKKWISPCLNINQFILESLSKQEVISSPFFRPQTDYITDNKKEIPKNLHLYRFENLNTDIQKLPKEFKTGHKLPHLNSSSKKSALKPLLSKEAKKALTDIYFEDFEYLNYEI